MSCTLDLMMIPSSDRQLNGISDAGVQTFNNNRIRSLTKEEAQNATDQFLSADKKVILEFNDFMMPVAEIPASKKLLTVVEDDGTFWDNSLKHNKTAVGYLNNAGRVIKQKYIRVLRVSDNNTTGLTGIEDRLSPFDNLVYNNGVSDKAGTSGGSHGIGKNAAHAFSQLRLVFYCTKNIEGASATIGVIKLPGYEKDGVVFTGKGYFANAENLTTQAPIPECLSFDPTYHREHSGLDKYIMGIDETFTKEELRDNIIIATINSFLFAFLRDKFEVIYDDIILNKYTILNILEEYKDRINPIILEQYNTYKNPERVVNFSMFEENDVTYYVTLNPEASRKAAVVRLTGMKIFDRSQILKRIGFSAVILFNGEKINKYFRDLENIEHNNWSEEKAADLVDTEEEKKIARKEAKKNIDLLFENLRNIIKDMNNENFDIQVDADGLGEYLPMDYVSSEHKNTKDSLSNEIQVKNIRNLKEFNLSATKKVEELSVVEDECGQIMRPIIEAYEKEVKVEDADDVKEKVENEETSQNVKKIFGDEPMIEGVETKLLDNDSELSNSTEVEGINKILHEIEFETNFNFTLTINNGVYNLRLTSRKDIKKGFIEIRIAAEGDPIVSNLLYAKINDNKAEIFTKHVINNNSKSKDRNFIELKDIVADKDYNISFLFEDFELVTFALEVHIYEY